ncbi:LysM domain-containing protein [Heracleum sosnowskyi]|uniref:LysM domain-containing protein n=1 Tax=Heracleum sosnowskyi TaxID=360622 RepID=A0AAD8HJV8_9APIA|nr:LysM domain-containing protein [Heracleum sosnowskyi]
MKEQKRTCNMAKSSNSKSSLCILIIFSLLLILTVAESRQVSHNIAEAPAALICDLVFGVNSGDTCFSIAQGFGLSSGEFESINPNVNCAALFVGQWICVEGSS